MNEKFEKKLKAFLPYIIIIGVVYLLAPALLFIEKEAGFLTYFVLIGVLPITTGCCCAHYSIKKENDFYLCLVAPIFFIPSMFLYGIFQSSVLRALIYLVAYLLCGYLGLTIGDILKVYKGMDNKKSGNQSEAPAKPAHKPAERTPAERTPAERKPAERKPAERKPAARKTDRGVDPDTPIRRSRSSSSRPERVDVDSHDPFVAADPYADESLDTSTTSDDIDAILSEIHQRRDND